MFVKIKDRDNLVRDTETRFLMNTNYEELKAYYDDKNYKIKEIQEKQALENKVNKLEEDITEIKNLLQQVVTRI